MPDDFEREFPLLTAEIRSRGRTWVHPDQAPRPRRRWLPRAWPTWAAWLVLLVFAAYVVDYMTGWVGWAQALDIDHLRRPS